MPRRPKGAQYLMACSYCGAWRDDAHPPTCRAFHGRSAWIAEGHREECIEMVPDMFSPRSRRMDEALTCGINAPHQALRMFTVPVTVRFRNNEHPERGLITETEAVEVRADIEARAVARAPDIVRREYAEKFPHLDIRHIAVG